MDVQDDTQLSADALPFARCYQVEALEKAMKENTIVYLETGSGKTLIAIMLLRSYAYLIRKPSRFFAVFLVPKVVLVSQQAEAIEMHTDLKVGMYWGEMGVDFWDPTVWQQQLDRYEVLVMTPAILLKCLRHSVFKLDMIKVLIMDECHHARGKDPYACIMTEFYHPWLRDDKQVPRIFGMTASPIKSKGGSSDVQYWKNIKELETLLNSKVYTCASESVLARYIPFPSTKFKKYEHMEIPFAQYSHLVAQLKGLVEKYEVKLKRSDIEKSSIQSTVKKIQKILCTFIFCLDELGLWLALKAAQSISRCEVIDLSWGNLNPFDERIVKDFSQDVLNTLSACIPSDPNWSGGDNVQGYMDAGFITCKVVCLIESLLEYRGIHDIRCIIFVERVVTAIVLMSLLSEVLPKYCSWKTKYIAGNNSGLLSQTRKQQNEIVEEFRNGKVNVLVATSILEEGLDVQSCNLVIRFDPSTTVSSFIQSRGRARMQNSDYLLMVESGDSSTHSRLENYLSSAETMRKESLRHAAIPCEPLNGNLDDEYYQVASTGAIVTLASSVELIHFYCSQLPSDSYFKPAPRFVLDKEMNTCTLTLPKSCPIQTVCVQGNLKMLKRMACLEACKQLHMNGALTDSLIPAIVEVEANTPIVGNEAHNEDQPAYFPPELVNSLPEKSKRLYHCYVIELRQSFNYDATVQDIVLATRSELEADICGMSFKLEVFRGSLTVNVRDVGEIHLDEEQVHFCRRFQMTLLSVLLHQSLTEMWRKLDVLNSMKTPEVDYLLLPHASAHPTPGTIDWRCVLSVLFSIDDHICGSYLKCRRHRVRTKNGLVSRCMLERSLVYTPHNGEIYCVTGFFDDMNANSPLRMRDGTVTSYKNYYEERWGIKLSVEEEFLLKGRHIFHVPNCLQRCHQQKEREASNASVELPPELCYIILSPVSVDTLYSFSFAPPVMHQLEALLVAANLKRVLSDSCPELAFIPTMKVLEALTTKRCQERYHLESLETLGDSFLKYAVCQQLFRTYQSHHEGLLSIKKDKLISNETLCKLGCDHKLPGFVRNKPFDPKTWIIPGDICCGLSLCEELLPKARKMYTLELRKLKEKTVADVVEALLGAYVIAGGENAGLFFVRWLGIEVDFGISPYNKSSLVNPEKLINIKHIESLLSYSFRDPSLLVEALSHGSYMLPEIPTCYQRLEFLGDSVLDYLVTIHLYRKYPGLSPGILTDLRSASVNNDCYALSAIKVGLHKHILHASTVLHKHIADAVNNFEKLSSEFSFGWECDTSFPKVLGDIIESLAGAILVDSDYDKERVFQSIRPLLEPLVSPETLRPHPVRELSELCQKERFVLGKPIISRENGVSSVTIEVEAGGAVYRHTSRVADKKTAKRLASKEVLKSLKENIPGL